MMDKHLENLCSNLLKTGRHRWVSDLVGKYLEDCRDMSVDKAEELLYDRIIENLEKEQQ